MASQLTVKQKNKTWLKSETLKSQIIEALPKGIEVEHFCRSLFTAVQKVPKLMECTQESLYSCIIESASFGLEPNGRDAHLIPYGNKCTLIPDYKGLVNLAYRSERISNIHADVVCENDDFEHDRGEVKKHSFCLGSDRGKVIGAYAYCRFKDGAEKYEVMGIDELNKIKARSKSASNGPWKTDENEMFKKTVFKRMSKWLPLSADVLNLVERDNDDYRGYEKAKQVTPASFSDAPREGENTPSDKEEIQEVEVSDVNGE